MEESSLRPLVSERSALGQQVNYRTGMYLYRYQWTKLGFKSRADPKGYACFMQGEKKDLPPLADRHL